MRYFVIVLLFSASMANAKIHNCSAQFDGKQYRLNIFDDKPRVLLSHASKRSYLYSEDTLCGNVLPEKEKQIDCKVSSSEKQGLLKIQYKCSLRHTWNYKDPEYSVMELSYRFRGDSTGGSFTCKNNRKLLYQFALTSCD